MLTPFAAARNESFCAMSSPPISARCIGDDLAGIRRAERDLLLLAAPVLKHGHEQRLAGQQALAGAHQRAQERRPAAASRRRRSSPSRCRRPCTSCRRPRRPPPRRVELDFDVLHVVAEDLVVDDIHLLRASRIADSRLQIVDWIAVRQNICNLQSAIQREPTAIETARSPS